MKRPRRIEYEFEEADGSGTYHYWELYAKELEEFIDYLAIQCK